MPSTLQRGRPHSWLHLLNFCAMGTLFDAHSYALCMLGVHSVPRGLCVSEWGSPWSSIPLVGVPGA